MDRVDSDSVRVQHYTRRRREPNYWRKDSSARKLLLARQTLLTATLTLIYKSNTDGMNHKMMLDKTHN